MKHTHEMVYEHDTHCVKFTCSSQPTIKRGYIVTYELIKNGNAFPCPFCGEDILEQLVAALPQQKQYSLGEKPYSWKHYPATITTTFTTGSEWNQILKATNQALAKCLEEAIFAPRIIIWPLTKQEVSNVRHIHKVFAISRSEKKITHECCVIAKNAEQALIAGIQEMGIATKDLNAYLFKSQSLGINMEELYDESEDE